MEMCDFLQGFQNLKAYVTKPRKSWDRKIIAVLCTRHNDIDFFYFLPFFVAAISFFYVFRERKKFDFHLFRIE